MSQWNFSWPRFRLHTCSQVTACHLRRRQHKIYDDCCPVQRLRLTRPFVGRTARVSSHLEYNKLSHGQSPSAPYSPLHYSTPLQPCAIDTVHSALPASAPPSQVYECTLITLPISVAYIHQQLTHRSSPPPQTPRVVNLHVSYRAAESLSILIRVLNL